MLHPAGLKAQEQGVCVCHGLHEGLAVNSSGQVSTVLLLTGAFQAPPAESRPFKMLQKSPPSSGPREGCHNKKLCLEGWTTSSVGVNVLYEKENPTKLIKHKHSPSARRTQHGCLHKVHHKLLVLGIPYANEVGLVIKIYHSI